MNKKIIKDILYMIIAIFLGVIIVKFIVWLLPIVLIGIISYYIYKSIKKNRKENTNQKRKNKTIKIIEMVEENDK